MKTFLGSFGTNPKNIKDLSDLIGFTERTPEEMNNSYGMKHWIAAEEAGRKYNHSSSEYKKSLARRLRIAQEVPRLLDEYDCDILVAPSWTESTANFGGCPTVSVPMRCYPDDFPPRNSPEGMMMTGPNIPWVLRSSEIAHGWLSSTSILFIGRRYDDARLIDIAYQYEQVTRHRDAFKPVIQPTAGLLGEGSSDRDPTMTSISETGVSESFCASQPNGCLDWGLIWATFGFPKI